MNTLCIFSLSCLVSSSADWHCLCSSINKVHPLHNTPVLSATVATASTMKCFRKQTLQSNVRRTHQSKDSWNSPSDITDAKVTIKTTQITQSDATHSLLCHVAAVLNTI